MTSRRTRRSFLASAVAGGTLLAGCTGGVGEQPPKNVTSGLSVKQVAPTSVQGSAFTTAWKTGVPGDFTLSTPAIDGDRLYVGSGTQATAIDRPSGKRVWQQSVGAMAHSFSPRVADDVDVVLTCARDLLNRRRLIDRGGTPSLTAFDAGSGARRWRERLPISASPLVVGDTVVVPLVDDEETALTARSLATGEERWRTTLSTPDVFAAPALGEDGLYVTTVAADDDTAQLVALTPDGDIRWTHTLEGAPHKGPVVDDRGDGDVVYVGTSAGILSAVGGDGAVRWQSMVGGAVNTTPVLGDDQVFTTTPRRVVALDAETGAGQWMGKVEHVAKTGLSVSGGMVHVGGNEVAAFDVADGTPRWRVQLPGVAGTFGSPLYTDDTLYAGGCVKHDGNDRYDHSVWALR